MKFIKKNWKKLILAFYLFIIPVVSFAADDTTPKDPCAGKICDPLGGRFAATGLPGLIQSILEGFIKIGIPIVALAIVYCGFLFVFARGNSEKLTKAKDALLYTLIGAAVLLGALAIAKLISVTVLAL